METPEMATYAVVTFVWILIKIQEITGCGVISQEEPSVKGRYIRLLFTPHSPPSPEEEAKWFIYRNGKWHRMDRSQLGMTSRRNDTFILDYKTNVHGAYIDVYAKTTHSSCQANPQRINLRVEPGRQNIDMVPPDAVDVQLKVKDVNTSIVTCYVTETNAECAVAWEVGGEPRQSGQSQQITYLSGTTTGTSMKNYTYISSIEMTKADNGKKLSCVVTCNGFPPKPSAGQIILVPYEPIVTLDTSSQVNITEGEPFVANCTVDSHPEANITWLSGSGQESPHGEPCGPQSVCLRFENVSSSHSGDYTCVAQNRLTREQKKSLSIFLNTRSKLSTEEKNEDHTEPTDFLVPVVTLSAVVTVLVGIIVVIVVMKTKRSTSEIQQPADNIPAADSGQGAANTDNSRNGEPDGAACYATIADSDTYAQPVPKALRQKGNSNAEGKLDNTPKGGDTYSTPLPKSQRKQTTSAVTSPQESDVYSQPLPRSQRGSDAATTDATKSRETEAGRDLVYADLDHQTLAGGQPSGMSRSPADAGVEYMDLDFTRKADRLSDDADDNNV